MPRKLSRMTLRRREQQAIGGVHSLSEVNPQAVVQRYIAGETIKDMAAQYGVQDTAMYHFLLRNCPEDWKAAKLAKAHALTDGGIEELDRSQEPLSVAIAREKIRAGQWDLERLDRQNYGREDHNINITFVDLGERLRRAKERSQGNCQVIEHQESTAPSVALACAQGKSGLQPANSAQILAGESSAKDSAITQVQQSEQSMGCDVLRCDETQII